VVPQQLESHIVAGIKAPVPAALKVITVPPVSFV